MSEDSSIFDSVFVETIKVRRFSILSSWLKIYLILVTAISIFLIFAIIVQLMNAEINYNTDTLNIYLLFPLVNELFTATASLIAVILIVLELKKAILAMMIVIVAKLGVYLVYAYILFTGLLSITALSMLIPTTLNIIFLIAFARCRKQWENEAVRKSEATVY